MNFFESLSVDNINDISKLLDMKSLCRLIMSSKELKELCDTNEMWKYHYLLTIKDKWKITEDSVHICRGHGDFIYLYEFNDGENKIQVKSFDSPNGYAIRNMECPGIWDYRKNVKYLGIYRGETPYIPDNYNNWRHNTDYVIRGGCMNCQFNLIKSSNIVGIRQAHIGVGAWRKDIVDKWRKLNKDNGLSNLCQNPMHYDINTLEIPGSCRGYKNYKKVIIKKLYTKQKNSKNNKKYTNDEIKLNESIETYKEQIKYCEQQIIISKKLAKEEKHKLKRLEDAIESV
jgi:hypothetical protein